MSSAMFATNQKLKMAGRKDGQMHRLLLHLIVELKGGGLFVNNYKLFYQVLNIREGPGLW